MMKGSITVRRILVGTLLTGASACSGGGGGDFASALPGIAPEFDDQPMVSAAPNQAAPLAAGVSLSTNVPTEVTLRVDDGVETREFVPEPGLRRDHELTVLGLRPDTTHSIEVIARDGDDDEATAPTPLTITTAALPAVFPPLELKTGSPTAMEPGVTLFNARFTHPTLVGATWGMLLIVDEDGEVLWFYETDQRIGDARRLANGNLIYLYGRNGMREIDMRGNVVNEWWAARETTDGAPAGAILVDTDSFHHEVIELPASFGADFAVLSSEKQTYTDYPDDLANLASTEPSAEVVGDVLIEIRRDGTVVNSWFLLDMLDPYRVSYGSLDGFWNAVYGETTRDWTHANAAILNADASGYIVSARHQETVFEFDRASGNVTWMLGPHEGWTTPWSNRLLTADDSVEPVEWNFHQHAPMLTPGGGLVMFDNGNGRAVPPAPELDEDDRYSRVVEYRIDADLGTVEQLWSYGGPADPWYSRFLGDADHLPTTGNILVTDGGKTTEAGKDFGRVFEVTRDDPAEIVWELEMRDGAALPEFNWSIYRAERLPALYP